ncbi:MAG: energy-coupling factor ABC transporter ATP-binding protein, partial [Methanosarcinales archaeon]
RLGLNYIIPLNAEEAIKLLKLNKKKVKHQLQKNPTFFKKTIPKFSASILTVDGVYFAYSKKYILQDINLKIGSGEMVALIGNNGSGKTTLLLHFATILKPTDGILYFKGKDTKKLDPYTLAGEVGVVFQNPDLMLFCDTVLEEVSFGPRNLNISESEVNNRVNSALKAMNLQDLKYEPPLALSRGQRFRVAVASILSMKPDLILLDEPTTGQDKVHIESLMQYLKKLTKTGITVVFITHDLETALKYADRLMVLNSGKIIADGTPREVFSNLKLLEKAKLKPPTSYIIGKEFGIVAFSLEELVEGYMRRYKYA